MIKRPIIDAASGPDQEASAKFGIKL